MVYIDDIEFMRHRVAGHRRHYITEDDVRVILSRLPEDLYVRLKRVLFKDDAQGRRVYGYTTTRGRREVSLCALPPRVSLSQVCTKHGFSPERFGALRGTQWPTLAVRRYLLYNTFLHEIGHLQVILPGSGDPRRKFAHEGKAQAFANEWRRTLWSQPFDHPDPVHNPPGENELKALKAGWGDAHLSYKRGLRLEQEKDRQAAARHFSRAVKLYPNHSLALERFGILTFLGHNEHCELGEASFREAAAILRRAIELDPALPEAHLYLAMGLDVLDEPKEAQDMFRRAIRLDPYENTATVMYAAAHSARGYSDEAGRLFAKVLRKDPENSFALRSYARHYLAAADEDGDDAVNQAIDLLRRAQDIDPRDPYTHFYLGLAFSQLGDHEDEAVKHLRECLRLKPDHQKASELLKENEKKGTH